MLSLPVQKPVLICEVEILEEAEADLITPEVSDGSSQGWGSPVVSTPPDVDSLRN